MSLRGKFLANCFSPTIRHALPANATAERLISAFAAMSASVHTNHVDFSDFDV